MRLRKRVEHIVGEIVAETVAEGEPVWVLYDGTCGVCHRGVSFLVRRDRRAHLRFAPLGGETHLRLLGATATEVDSLLVIDRSGAVRMRSDGTAAALRELNAPWPMLGRLLALVPRRLRDGGYDLVARNRLRFSKTPPDVCPVLPPELRSRFGP